jgi:hypothetical protein
MPTLLKQLDTEDGGSMPLRNIDSYLAVDMS